MNIKTLGLRPRPRYRRRTHAQRLGHRTAGRLERLEDRVLLAVGPQLISVQPNVGNVLLDGAVRDIAPKELTFVFDEGQAMDADTLAGIRVTRAGFDNAFDGVSDVIIQPGYAGVDPDRPNEVIVRFAETLPDDRYRIELFAVDDVGAGLVAVRNVDGDPLQPKIAGTDRDTVGFELDLGAQIIAVVPQPVEREVDTETNDFVSLSQARNQIEVYFNEDPLDPASASNVDFYQLIFTDNTASNLDDEPHNPIQVDYDPLLNKATLTFAEDIGGGPDEPGALTRPGTYRLRVGTDEPRPEPPLPVSAEEDPELPPPGTSFDTARPLGTIDRSLLISGQIMNDGFPLDYPGSSREPGHRDHLAAKDESPGIEVIQYNFKEIIGADDLGNPVFNLITPNQIQRAREVFELYSFYLGVSFVETAEDGLTIATGDTRFAADDILVVDNLQNWDDKFGEPLNPEDPFGETLDPLRLSWFEEAMRQVGTALGMVPTPDAPPFNLMGQDPELEYFTKFTTLQQLNAGIQPSQFIKGEHVYPGDYDLVQGRHLHRPESTDIDVYQLSLPEPGVFSAEVIAERLEDSSLLDGVLTLYREQDGQRQIIARNDDYFSEDSLIRLELDAGTYYVAVTSTGNVDFDPTVEDSGFDGTSEGPYQLRIDFAPRVDNFLVDATGTAFDGNADGVPGGVYNFWFRAVPLEQHVFVDKGAPQDFPDSQGGTVPADGSLQRPFNNLPAALNDPEDHVQSGEILRIVGDGGDDGDLSTVEDNLAYELGIANGNLLDDGGNLVVPQGVTVMVEAGAIFKLLKGNIQVGSSSATIDRSESALQILGTPELNVIFTSYDDREIGSNSNPRPGQKEPGDWGGIIFQNDVDLAEGRFNYEQVGIFLNYVDQADLRYGGGNVTVDAAQQVVNPIHMVDARPTIRYNSISFSADAAFSANPDSFQETNFHAVDSRGIEYQEELFTPDYDRVGPDLRGNHLIDNSINGIFVRISTPAGDSLHRMTVTGRWDDTEVVHIVAENLLVEGRPGGPVLSAASGLHEARVDAGLKIDPGIVVKLDGSRIETTVGAQLLAEGLPGQEIILTSLQDDRYGAGGTYRTNAAEDNPLPEEPAPGDWGGVHIGAVARGSIDHAVIAYGGGLTRVEGSFANFNAVESRQGVLRLTNSLLNQHEDGHGGQAEASRAGRGSNREGAIFVRGAQPIIVGNVIKNTVGYHTPVINVDANSLNATLVQDYGRSTGLIDLITDYTDNHGPLIRGNRLAGNSLNGMIVRGETLTTEGVWDDTDIVHILFDEIVIPDFHTFGGLRLESSPTESLVVKLQGNDAGFQATGRPRDYDDRIGGMLHILGQPGRPVVLTSLSDDSVGAGFDPSGTPQTDTDGPQRPERTQLPGSFQIDLNFGPVIARRPHIMGAVQEAARIWERLVEDPVTVTFDFELADTGDGNLGGAMSEFSAVDYDLVRQAMIADGRPDESVLPLLPDFASLQYTLPNDPGNPFTVSDQIRLTNSNAKALGLDPAVLTLVPSQYDPTEFRDANIRFNLDPILLDSGDGSAWFFDFDRSDGIQPGYFDFISTVVHEMGHALGFVSAVDDVDRGLLNPANPRDIQLQPLDLFRLEPGDGAVDFTGAPRALDPALVQVFYDGGTFDPVGIDIARVRRGDIPVSTGSTYGDGGQASHWKDDMNPDMHRVYVGLMDPFGNPSLEQNLSFMDRVAFDLIGWDVVGGGIPGDWRGLTLEQFSSDRNVAVVTELEPADVTSPGTNALPATSQFLGMLGQEEKDSDDNLRLAFDVHGFLSKPSDIDVYSFSGTSGTEVWIDIDRTGSALDAVVELIDSNGRVLARSDNSLAEQLGEESRYAAPGVAVYGLQKSIYRPEDFWTVNPKDPGMRLVLPGPASDTRTYNIRVRSSSEDLDVLSDGQTSGAYQLQIRLNDLDERGGSTVQFADISYAVDGVRVKGLPRHSPLLGDQTEDAVTEEGFGIGRNNDTELPRNSKSVVFSSLQDAHYLGDLLTTDQATISVAGSLNTAFDFDWYRFQLSQSADVILDLDYASGLNRANTSFWIYEAVLVNDSNPSGPGGFQGGEGLLLSGIQPGNLVYSSQDGRVTDDMPAPFAGDNLDDLSRGSVAPFDPFLGPISLFAGEYLVLVTQGTTAPCEYGQFLERLPCNPLVRAEPIPDLRRIAEDRIAGDPPPPGIPLPLEPPQVPILVNPSSAAVPFTLGDVQLFVSTATGLSTVDPFTGIRETTLGDYAGDIPEVGTLRPVIGDFALRDNPLFDPANENPEIARRQRLYAYTQDRGDGIVTDATAGNYLWIDIDPLDQPVPPDGEVLIRGVGEGGAITDDGILTFHNGQEDPDAAEPDIQRSNGGEGEGIIFDAITFAAPAPEIDFGYAIGRRPVAEQTIPPTDMGYTPPVNLGYIPNVLFRFEAATGLAVSATGGDREDNERIPVANPGPVPAPAIPVEQPNAGTQQVEAGVLEVSYDNPDTGEEEFGGNITGLAFARGSLMGITDLGHLYRILGQDGPGASARYVATITDEDGDGVPFQGLSVGPANVEGGAYSSLMFGIAGNGDLYAFDASGELQPVFVDAQTSVSTGVGGAVGLEFATLDNNLWHVTMERGADPGHTAANSFYFGENADTTTTASGIGRRYDFLGGAQGTLVTEPFSLAGYAATDIPALYFNYFLLTEETTGRDSFRVFVSDNGREDGRGAWEMVASNQAGEFDPTGFGVQPLFDNTWQDVPFLMDPEDLTSWQRNGDRDPFPYPDEDGQRPFDPGDIGWGPFDPPLNETLTTWRQAKIDLSAYAGSDDLRLRFDFSTAASFDLGGANTTGGSQLAAIDGARLRDGDLFTVDDQVFEFDLGYTVVPVPGQLIADGETMTIDGVTFEFTRGDAGPGNVAIPVTDESSPLEIADSFVAALATAGLASVTPHQDGARVNLEGALAVTQSPDAVVVVEGTPGVTPDTANWAVVIHSEMSAEDVAEAMRQPLADAFAGGVVDVVKAYRHVVHIIGHDVADPGPLGYAPDLPGDANGTFGTRDRFLANTQIEYAFGDEEEQDFQLLQEGVYVDDVIIGFAKQGEIRRDDRPVNPLLGGAYPDPFLPDSDPGNFGGVPAVDTNAVGEYQMEIRLATSFGPGMLDPRDRLAQSATLIAPAGMELFDGKTFTLSDGLHTVVFEYEDQAIGDGVADGHVAVPFDTTDSAFVLAEHIRDAINGAEAEGRLQIRAALSDGVVAGAGTTTNRVDLIGNALVVPQDPPNGIETLELDPNRYGTPNTRRDQGQVILHSNRILDSVQYGIVVEDGLRDLPEYRFFDRDDVTKHAQFTHGDYVPHSGAVRNLSEVNQDRLTPGVTIANNVLAFNGEGGVHFSGDPNGYLLTAPVMQNGNDGEAREGWEFMITDHNGTTVMFVLQQGPGFRFDGTGQAPPFIDIVPVSYTETNNNAYVPFRCTPDVHLIAACTNRYHPVERDAADSLMHAIDSSVLDVTLYRGTGDEIFIEGAMQILGTNPISWIEPYITEIQRGGVPYGRIINNTIVGLGGTLESNNLYNEFDYQDVGILIEDNADPTLINNLIVNFEDGISTDLSSTSVILGGTLFQGNVDNTQNINEGDFSLVVPSDAPMFVDRERGNFYPAAGSRAIDSALDSLEDRPSFVTIRDPLGISPSPILAPAFDVLGQLRMDDPRVEPPSGVGQNVFKDRGAVDRVDFAGPRSQIVQPQDNDSAGLDQNPELDHVRLDNANLNAFVLQLTDIGEAGTATGTGIDDDLVTSDSVVVLRDGVPLEPGVDYRFDYQTTTDQILLTPQAGVWLTGYAYEIRLVNQDSFLIAPPPADQIADGEVLQITDGQGSTTLFEFESGYTLEVPLPLGLLVPPGTSGLSEVADRDLFTISNGVRLVTFEFDSNDQISSGRIRVPFTPSDTPEQVGDAIVDAVVLADLGLAPQNLADGQVHIGGPFSTLLDVSLSSLVSLGTPGAIFDGEVFSIQNSQTLASFEFDEDGDVALGNLAIPFTSNDTQQQLSDAVAEAIRGTDLNLDAQNVGDGRVHLGGTPDVVVLVGNSSLNVVGQPGTQSNPGGRELVPIVYVPSSDTQGADVSHLIQDAIASSSLSGLLTYVDESGQVVVVGAEDVQGTQVIPEQFVPGIRDLAGNYLQTNLDDPPFDVRYFIELPAPLDFGDTPDLPYATLLASDGPRHVLVPNIFLGDGIDAELDANIDSEANGDLFDDGVQFEGPITPRGWVTVSIVASTNGLVDAWIDYNTDGVFDPSQERILASVPVQIGDNSFVVTVPDDAALGTTFARFRFSTAGGLSPTGRADNGEVEDYQVEIVDIAAPIAVDDNYELDEDTVLTKSAAEGVLANDQNSAGGELRAVILTDPAHGSVELNLDGSFEYTPDPDYFGEDMFTYRAETDILPSNVATVNFVINGVPDPPVAGDDEATTLEDEPVLIDLVANDFDPDGALDRGSIEIVEPPANGEVVVNPNGTALYTPDPDYHGTDIFRYTIKDLEGAVSNVATVTITIISVNDPPVAVDDVIFTLQGEPQDADLIENDYDVDGFINPQSIVITLNPKSGTVRVNGDGTITFLPSPSFLGNDTFRYTVRDNEGATSNQAVVTINVVDENLPPIAVDDDGQTTPGEPVTIDVVANDIDTDGTIVPGSVTIVQDPLDGIVVNNFDGTVTYTPDLGYTGVAIFTYTVRDDFNAVSNVAAVRVTVAYIGPPWQNPDNPLDVDGDGHVVPLDALLVINEINDGGSRPLDDPPIDEPPYEPPPYLDVNGDDFLSPLDALMVINALNSPQPVAAVAAPVAAPVTWSETHLIGAALDIEPRFQPSSTTRTAVDQVFVDTEAATAADLPPASQVSSSWTTDPPRPIPADADPDGEELLEDGLLELVAQGIHDLPEGADGG